LEILVLRKNPLEEANLSRGKFKSLLLLEIDYHDDLILNEAELTEPGLQMFFSQVAPVNASLIGLRFPNGKPPRLLRGSHRLKSVTVDQDLYKASWLELNSFASHPGNSLTIIGYGDANADGFFDSTDLVQVFQAGEYEDEITDNSYWITGDWNSDGDFDSSDLVIAFQAGQYEAEAAVVAVPEPSAMVLLLFGVIALSRSRARIR